MSLCSVCVWDFSIRLFLVLLPLGVQVGGPVSLLGCPEKRCTFRDCDGTIKGRFCLPLGFAQSICASAIIVFLLDSLANPHRSLKLPSSHCNKSVGLSSSLASCIFITPAFLLVFYRSHPHPQQPRREGGAKGHGLRALRTFRGTAGSREDGTMEVSDG